MTDRRKKNQAKFFHSEEFEKSFLILKKQYQEGKLTMEEAAKISELPLSRLSQLLAPERFSKTVLVTGGAGFIGSNFIHYLLEKYPTYKIINFDKLTYAGNLDNLRAVEKDPRYEFVRGDIASLEDVEKVFSRHKIDYVVNFAAETHVERSIYGARDFVITNVLGTQTLLDAVNKWRTGKMVHISTDESYGSLTLDDNRSFTEKSPLKPNVPYSATKAGSDLMCRAYYETYKTPVVVSHCTNNFGQYQFPEKVVPLFTLRAYAKKPLTLHGRGQHVRDWLYVRDHCSAIDKILHQGKEGEIYNIAGGNELPTYYIAEKILKLMGRPKSLIKYIPDRPGNDLKYSLSTKKIRTELAWKPEYPFENYLENTVNWYLSSDGWLERLKNKKGDLVKVLNI